MKNKNSMLTAHFATLKAFIYWMLHCVFAATVRQFHFFCNLKGRRDKGLQYSICNINCNIYYMIPIKNSRANAQLTIIFLQLIYLIKFDWNFNYKIKWNMGKPCIHSAGHLFNAINLKWKVIFTGKCDACVSASYFIFMQAISTLLLN